MTHGTCTPFTVRSPGGRPISRMRTPGNCRWTSRQQCSRNHWIPRWLVGVSPLPMKPMLAVRRKERSWTAIGVGRRRRELRRIAQNCAATYLHGDRAVLVEDPERADRHPH